MTLATAVAWKEVNIRKPATMAAAPFGTDLHHGTPLKVAIRGMCEGYVGGSLFQHTNRMSGSRAGSVFECKTETANGEHRLVLHRMATGWPVVSSNTSCDRVYDADTMDYAYAVRPWHAHSLWPLHSCAIHRGTCVMYTTLQ